MHDLFLTSITYYLYNNLLLINKLFLIKTHDSVPSMNLQIVE